jgi:hypothetical protein
MARLELMDTVELMGSSDYRDRFVAEYIQLKIRYEKLKAFNTKIEAACRTQNAEEPEKKVPMPTHDCPASLLREQQAEMGQLLHIFEVRAVIEDIDLTDAMMYLEGKKVASSTASGRLAAARSQNGSDVINVIQDRSAATLPSSTRSAGEGLKDP